MPEVVELQMIANQAFDVINQLQSRMTALEGQINKTGGGRGGDAIGESFLRSERRVSRSAANISSSLLTSNDAVQALATTFLQLEYATKLGLGAGIGIAIGIAAFEAIYKQFEETRKAREALERDVSKPLALIVNLAPADIAAQITQVDKELTDLKSKHKNFASQATKGFTSLGFALDESANATLATEATKEKDQNQSEIEKSEQRLKDLANARGDAELRIVANKEKAVHVSAEQAEIEKAQIDFLAGSAKLLDGAFKPGADQSAIFKQVSALSKTRDLAQEIAEAKGFVGDTDFQSASEIANFQGTPEEKKGFAAERNIQRLQDEKDFLQAFGHEEEAKKKGLELDQATSAEAQRKLDLQKSYSDLLENKHETQIKAAVAQASVNLAPEDTQRLNLQAQVVLAAEKAKHARDNVASDATNVGYQNALTTALGNQVVAMATLQKFDQERVFNSTQELNNAKSKTRELQLQAAGNTFAAGQAKINDPAQSQIAKLLHDNKPLIASEVAQQANLQGEAQLGSRLTETAAQQRAREDAERAAKSAADQAHAAVLDAQNREEHGATLDENNPVTQQLRAEQERAAQLAEGEKPQAAEDFSSVASLAGQDFSSLASLGSLDFSGIATLAGLSISIA